MMVHYFLYFKVDIDFLIMDVEFTQNVIKFQNFNFRRLTMMIINYISVFLTNI